MPVPTAVPGSTAMPEITGGNPKVDRLVVTGTVQAFESTDPYAMTPSSLPPVHPMYENLLQFDRNTLEYTPMLAKSWKTSPDFSSVTFQLQEGVQWHKGYGEFTSEDVVNTYAKMVSEESVTTYVAQWKTFLNPEVPESNFDIIGPKEITFNWAFPQLDWHLFVSRIIDFTIVSKAHLDAEGWVEGPRDNPIGTGPYQLLEHNLGEGYVYERVPYEHYRVTPDFPELEYKFTPEPTTRLAQLLAGEAHIAQLLPEQRKVAGDKGMVTVSTSVPSNTMYLLFAGQYLEERPSYDPNNPFLNKEVRQALNIAVNRTDIFEALFAPTDELMPSIFMHPSMIPSGMTGPEWAPLYDERFKWYEENYVYDPDKAKQLLADAGFPEGFTMKMYSYDRPAAPMAKDVVDAVALDWGRIGINVEIVETEFGAVRPLYRGRDEKNMGVATWIGTSRWDPLIWNRAGVHFIAKWPDGKNASVGGFEHESQDARFARLLDSTDRVERGQLEIEMMDFVQQEFAYIPIAWIFNAFTYDPNVVAEYKTIGIHGTRDLEFVKAVLE